MSEYKPLVVDESSEVDGGLGRAASVASIDADKAVDWEREPSEALAAKYRATLMARCTVDSAGLREPLDIAQGYENVDMSQARKWPIWSTSLEEMGNIGGPGVYVYFQLLSRLPWVFGIMALLNTPNLLLNLYGKDNMYDSPLLTRQYKGWWSRTTLGSVWAHRDELDAEDALEQHGSLFVRTVFDAVSMCFLLWFILDWRRLRTRLAQKADEAICSMSDYTVSVRPAAAWPEEFDRTDEENQKAAEFIHELDAAMEKKFGPVARIDDSPAIWLAYTERSVIRLSRKKSEQLLELEGALALSHKAGWSEESIAGVREAAAAVQSTNHEINDERAKGARAVEAFVTFEDSDDKEKAVDSGGCEYNGQVCKLRTPAEPEALHWDRLPIQPVEQNLRKYTILFATVVILALGFGGVVWADFMKANLDYLVGCEEAMHISAGDAGAGVADATTGYCDPFTLDPEHPPTWTEMAQAQEFYKERFDKASEVMGWGGQFPRVVTPKDNATVSESYLESGEGARYDFPEEYQCAVVDSPDMAGCCETTDNDLLWQEANASDCHRVDIIVEHEPDSHHPNRTIDVHVADLFRFADIDAVCYMCLCDCENQTMEGAIPGNESFSTCAPLTEGREQYCGGGEYNYHAYRSHVKNFKLLATFIVVCINQLVKRVILKSQPWMGLHDQGDDNGSIAARVFLLQLCMTGVLVILLRADIPLFSLLPQEKYSNVSARWYSVVGAPLIKTMGINFIAPTCVHVSKSIIGPAMKMCLARKKGKTHSQNQLNRAYSDAVDEWNLAASYGELLLCMTICLAYSSGIPVLLWVATFGFTLKFWSDKWCLLRAYRRPKQVDDDMFSQFGGLDAIMTVALLLHGGIGAWLYASAGGRDPRTEYHAHFERPYVVVFIVACCGMAVVWVLDSLRHNLGGKAKAAKSIPNNERLPPFSEAYTDQLLVNDDYDYEMDEIEEEEEFERAFGVALLKSLDGDRMPDELYQLCIDSVWDGADESKDEIARGLRDRGVQL